MPQEETVNAGMAGTGIESDTQELLKLLARRRATAGVPHREGGSTLYEIPAGWESLMIARDPAVCVVKTGFSLEDAFVDPAVKTIFVPRSSALTATVVKRVCARHGQGKTVFLEVESGNGKNAE
jgi:hypothetical protein